MMMERIALWAASLATRAREEEGQALVEYGLLLFLIAVVCILVLTTLGTNVSTTFQSIVDAL